MWAGGRGIQVGQAGARGGVGRGAGVSFQRAAPPADAASDHGGGANDLAVGGDNRIGQLVSGVTANRGVHLALLGRVEARRLRPAQRLCGGADLLAVIDREPLQAHGVEEGAVAEVAKRRDEHLAALAGHVHRDEARRVHLHHQAVQSGSGHVATEQRLHVFNDLLDLAGGAVVDEVGRDLELRGLVQLIVTHGGVGGPSGSADDSAGAAFAAQEFGGEGGGVNRADNSESSVTKVTKYC